MSEPKQALRTGRDSEQFMLRMPAGMRATFKDIAATNRRSLNSELVRRLENSLHLEQKGGAQ